MRAGTQCLTHIHLLRKKLEEVGSPHWTKAPGPCQHMWAGPEIRCEASCVAATPHTNVRFSGLVFFQLQLWSRSVMRLCGRAPLWSLTRYFINIWWYSDVGEPRGWSTSSNLGRPTLSKPMGVPPERQAWPPRRADSWGLGTGSAELMEGSRAPVELISETLISFRNAHSSSSGGIRPRPSHVAKGPISKHLGCVRHCFYINVSFNLHTDTVK